MEQALDPSPLSDVPTCDGETPGSRRRLLGELLIDEGLITELQLREALAVQRAQASPPPIGEILVECGALTPKQLNFILEKYHRKYRLGDILTETGRITPEQLEIALLRQRATGLRLGEVLLGLGFLTDAQLKQALAVQLSVPFVDLDALPVDRSLASLISEADARAHQVLPIAKKGNTLVLAMEDPTDLEAVEQFRAETGWDIEIVTSTCDAVLRGLTRAYGGPATDAAGASDGAAQLPVAPGAARADGRPDGARRPVPAASSGDPRAAGRLPDTGSSGALDHDASAVFARAREWLDRAEEAAIRALRELREQHAAQLADRRDAATEIEKILQRLRRVSQQAEHARTESFGATGEVPRSVIREA